MDPNQQAQRAAMEHARRVAERAHQQAHQHAVQQGWQAHKRFVQQVRREGPEGTGVGGCVIFLAIMAVMVLAVIGLLVFYVMFMVHPG